MRLRGRKLQATGPIVRIVASIIAFALAVYGFGLAYAALDGSSRPFSSIAFKALQLVVGRFPAELEDRELPWSLSVARWALPALTFWATFGLAWAQMRNPVRLYRIARRGEHLVIGGSNALAARIAAHERGAKQPIVLWTDDTKAAWVTDAADMGAPHSDVSHSDAGLPALGLKTARAVLLVGDNDASNINHANAIIEEARRVRPAGDPLAVVVRIDDLDLHPAIEERFSRVGSRGQAQLRVVSLPDVRARQLFLERPLDIFRNLESDSRTVFLLGFSPVVERYLLRMLAGAHFRTGARPRFVVFDPEAAQREQVFRARRPGADTLAPVVFEVARIDQPALIPTLLADAVARYADPVAIVVDTGDEARALAVSFACEQYYRQANRVCPPIHTRTGDCPEAQLGASIFPFGEAFGETEALLQERHDALARSVHDTYFEGALIDGDVVGSRLSMNEWEDLPERVRDDNRLVADCYRLKLHDIGARLIPERQDPLRLDAEEIEELARAEHDRWMAAKLIDGWVYGSKRDDAARIHPDIIPYNDLSERIKGLDREQIRLMSRLLPATGATPQRLLTLGVVEVESMSSSGEPVATTLATLKAEYPDRVLAFVGSFHSPRVRNTLAEITSVGVLVQIVVDRNIDAALDLLDQDERDRMRSMVRAADVIFSAHKDGADEAIDRISERQFGITPSGHLAPLEAVS